MTERYSGLLHEPEVQYLTLYLKYEGTETSERITLTPTGRDSPLNPRIKEISALRLSLVPNVCDLTTTFERLGGIIKRQSNISEMAILYQVAKHIVPDKKIVQSLHDVLSDSIETVLLEQKEQVESLEALKKGLGL